MKLYTKNRKKDLKLRYDFDDKNRYITPDHGINCIASLLEQKILIKIDCVPPSLMFSYSTEITTVKAITAIFGQFFGDN